MNWKDYMTADEAKAYSHYGDWMRHHQKRSKRLADERRKIYDRCRKRAAKEAGND